MSVADDRARIERALAKQFGPDWRNKAIVTPIGLIRLRDLPDEAGPAPAPPDAGSYGLWQMMPTRPLND